MFSKLSVRNLHQFGRVCRGFVPSTLKGNTQQIKGILRRSLKLVCPACGESKTFARPFRVRHQCPHCYALFKRQDVFFVGPLLANILITELVILVVCFFLLIVGADDITGLVLLIVMTLVLPVAFYHHSWSLWLGLDFIVESLPHSKTHHEDSAPFENVPVFRTN